MSTDIERWNPDAVGIAGLVTPVSYQPADGMTFEQWQIDGMTLRTIHGAVLWWIGDWLNFGEHHYGDTYAQALDSTDYALQTLMDAKWVASKVAPSQRRAELSWSHHKEVAALPPPEQDVWLTQAVDEQMTRAELRQRVHPKPEGEEKLTAAQAYHAMEDALAARLSGKPWDEMTAAERDEARKDARREAGLPEGLVV